MLLGDSVSEIDAAMGAIAFDQAVVAAAVAVQHQVLAEELDGLGGLFEQLLGGGDGVPVAAQQLPHGRAGPDPS